jgi:ATP:ADP antiporter, AAA family
MDIRAAIDRAVDAREDERGTLLWSFLMFFAVLASYFTVRPLREAMGAALPDGPDHLFTYVFFVMLALVPVFGFIATRVPRPLVLPVVYGFFIVNLFMFSAAMQATITPFVASCFFIWVSVYNLFVVSLFWSVMSDRWTGDQAKRVFGVIAAGGTLGSMVGPKLAEHLVTRIGAENLPLVSATFLGLALLASLKLSAGRSAAGGVGGSDQHPPVTLAAIMQGATRIMASPYLFRIALVIFLANLVSTYFYLEQTRLVKLSIPDRATRVAFFAQRDFMVSAATALIQLFGTARVISRFGLTAALVALPVVCIAGLVSIGLLPTLSVVAGVMVIERITAFGFAVPAMRVLYTAVDPDDKYKAQNFIDTVVVRGGDASSGLFTAFLGKTLGFSAAATIAATLPFAAFWLGSTLSLGRMHAAKVGETR